MNKGRWRGGEAAAATDESANLPFFLKKQRIAFEKETFSHVTEETQNMNSSPLPH